MHNIWTLYTK